MRAGQLRHCVTLRGIVEVDDGHHGWTKDVTSYARRIPAEVTPLSGRSLERAQQIDPRTTHQVRIRFRREPKSGDTVIYHDPDHGDRQFEVVAPPIDVEERRRELQLLCKEREAA